MPFKSINTRAQSASSVVNPTNLATSPLPSPMANGDLLLAITTCRSNTATVATPSGWTLWTGFPQRSATASGGSIYVFYRVVVGGETAPTLTWTGVATGTSGDSSQACIACFDRIDTASPIDAAPPAPTDASAGGAVIPGTTIVNSSTTAVGVGMKISDTNQTCIASGDYTEHGDFHTITGIGHNLFVGSQEEGLAGAIGSSPVTMSNAAVVRCLAAVLVVKDLPPANIATLVDDFNTGSVPDSSKWDRFGTIAPVLTGGQLRVQSDAASSDYAGIYTIKHWKLSGSSIFVQANALVFSGSHETTFQFCKLDISEWVGLVATGGSLGFGLDSALNFTAVPVYSSVTHAWWRMTESGGTITYATSPDGTAWTNRGTTATPPWGHQGTLQLVGGHWQAEAANTDSYFDNVNSIPSAAAEPIPALAMAQYRGV